MASRSASLIRVKLSTVRKIAAPGAIARCGTNLPICVVASLSSRPHDAWSGGPRPRYDRIASNRIAEAIAKVEAAINEDAPAAEPAAEPAQEPDTAKTKDDVRERLLAYQAKYGQEAVMEDGPRCLQLVFGDHVTKLSEIPPTPEDYAKACEAIDEMIVVNPYKRKPVNG